MFISTLFVAAACLLQLQPAAAGVFDKRSSTFKASSWVGETTSAVFPPPGASNTGSAFSSFFPDPTEVGFAGPTPTGDEAELVQTATSVPKHTAYYPLDNPSTFGKPPDDFNVPARWGNLAPWYTVESFGLDKANQLVPEGCELAQFHLVQRHGARYPASGSSPASFAAKLHTAVVNGTGFTATGPLSFLNTYQYKLGAELMTPFGRQQLFERGVADRIKYGELLKGFTNLPVIRTTSEERMVQSAQNYAAGFFGIPEYLTEIQQVVIIEADGFNNTLAPYDTCTNANTDDIGFFGDSIVDQWSEVYLASALKRLQGFIKGNLTFTISDMGAMQQSCAYETVELGSSDFCDLFTIEEWKGFEYANDLSFWYSDGPGNPTAAPQGAGWMVELLARLTRTPITTNDFGLNFTLSSSPVTFPLDQPIYLDFSHDVVIANIVTALNLTSLAAGGPLPATHIPSHQTYVTSQIAPFGSNLITQVLSCPAKLSHKSTPIPSNVAGPKNATHIRFILNDGVLPLTGLSGCAKDKDGLCEIMDFVKGAEKRLSEIDYEFACFGNYSIPVPDTITNGLPPHA